MSEPLHIEEFLRISRDQVFYDTRAMIRTTIRSDDLMELTKRLDRSEGKAYCHGRHIEHISIDCHLEERYRIPNYMVIVVTMQFSPPPTLPNCRCAPFERSSFLRDALKEMDNDIKDAMMYALGGFPKRDGKKYDVPASLNDLYKKMLSGAKPGDTLYDPVGRVKSKEVEDDALYYMIQSMQKEIEAEDYEAAAASKRDIEQYILSTIDIGGLKP